MGEVLERSIDQSADIETRIPPLSQLYAYLTEGCNLACRHCWLSPIFDTQGKHHMLSFDIFRTAVEEAIPLGLNTVKLTGGEPLLNPEIVTFLHYLRNQNLRLVIETNGVLCAPEIAREIADSQNPFVSVSIDGANAETHEWVRNVPGCFDEAMQGIRNLVNEGIRPQIIMSLMCCNGDQVDDVVRMAEDLGAGSVKFNIVQPTGRGEVVRDAADGLEIEELIELGRYVDMELSQTTDLQLIFDYPLAFRPISRMAKKGGMNTCGIQTILGLTPFGEYALCGIGERVPELVFGVVGKDKLEDIWSNNSTLTVLRDNLSDHLQGICSRCIMRHQCQGSCIAQNYYRTGDLFGSYWFCERASELGIFPTSRLEKV